MTDRTHYCAGCKGREDIIGKLEADNARLRAALEGVLTGSTDIECGERVIYAGAVNAVRAALQETSHEAP